MLNILKKLLKLWPFGRHGEPSKEAPAASSPRASGLSVEKGPRLPVTANGPFPADIIQAAMDSADAYLDAYIWPSVTLAQWALESNYGKSMPKGSNNPFGIKAKPGQQSVDAMTWEVIDGKRVNMKQSFRKFVSLEVAFMVHNHLLATSKYYKKARAAKSAPAFAKALTGIYATDPQYDAKLRSIMGKYNLYQYDRK